jgi:hypothetical protein
MKQSLFAVAVLLAVALPAMAQDKSAPSPQAQSQSQAPQRGGPMSRGMMGGDGQGMGAMSGGMMMGNMPGMLGRQIIPVTVAAIDAKAGLVEVNTGRQTLKFPITPAALAAIKVGDKLTVHIGFQKG